MSRKVFISLFFVVVVSVIGGVTNFPLESSQAKAQETTTWTMPNKDAEIKGDDSGTFKTLASRKGLSFKQRRAMGITIRNIRLKMVEMKQDGRLDGVSQAEVAIMVLNELITDNPQAFADPSIDWDGIIAFIERLIPLILKIMALFGL